MKIAGRLPHDHRAVAAAEALGDGPTIDVGAGSCFLALDAVQPYVAVDVTADVLGEAERRVVADVTALPFRSSSAGTTTCISVLQYVLDVEAAVAELHRVTRPGGTAIVLVPNIAFAGSVMMLARGRFPWSSPLDSWRGGTIRYFTKHDLLPMMQRHGFAVRAVRCSGRARRLRSRWASVLGSDLLIELERT